MTKSHVFKDRLGQLLNLGDPVVVEILEDLNVPKRIYLARVHSFYDVDISFMPKMVEVEVIEPLDCKDRKHHVNGFDCIKIGEYLLDRAMIAKIS